MADRASIRNRFAARRAVIRPEVQVYGGTALAAVAALVIGTASGKALSLALGMLFVAASVILVVVGSLRLHREEMARRASSLTGSSGHMRPDV